MARQYYSQRNIRNKDTIKFTFDELLFFFDEIYDDYYTNGAFNELFAEIGGKYTIWFMETLNKPALLPFDTLEITYSKDDLFDLIEILFHYINLPNDSPTRKSVISQSDNKITFNNARQTKQEKNQKEFRYQVNRLLSKFEDGYCLTTEGEIFSHVTDGLDILVSNEIEIIEDDSNDEKNADEVETAKALFLHHSATDTDKRNALLTLGRVLEENRKEIKQMFSSKDESDLFEILNRYNIRHSDISQKKDYPNEIYFDWMFYNLLAAIDAFYKIRNRNEIE